MALPKILQKLFTNGGAGPKLREDIMPKDYLPIAGSQILKAIRGSIDYWIDNNSGYFAVHGHTSDSDLNGAYLSLSGKDRDTFAGSFRLSASNGTEQTILSGHPDGTLTWGSNGVLTTANGLPLSGGTLTGSVWLNNGSIFNASDNSWTFISGGTGTDSAGLQLYGKEKNGAFSLWAKKDGASAALIGYPNGALFWSDKAVERINSYGTGYIRYESGLMIQWGASYLGQTTTFPQPFINNGYSITAILGGNSSSSNYAVLKLDPSLMTATTVQLTAIKSDGTFVTADDGWYCRFLAVGYWK